MITDFGVKQDDKMSCSAAIKKAVEACSKNGGGRVVVPEGNWLTGPVHLKSNVNLHIAENAVLKFSDVFEDTFGLFLPGGRVLNALIILLLFMQQIVRTLQ